MLAGDESCWCFSERWCSQTTAQHICAPHVVGQPQQCQITSSLRRVHVRAYGHARAAGMSRTSPANCTTATRAGLRSEMEQCNATHARLHDITASKCARSRVLRSLQSWARSHHGGLKRDLAAANGYRHGALCCLSGRAVAGGLVRMANYSSTETAGRFDGMVGNCCCCSINHVVCVAKRLAGRHPSK